MPANLTPEYLEAEERWREADTPEDKLEALHDMLRALPKHKGTEKMQAELRKRIAKMRDQVEKQKRSPAAIKRKPDWVVEKQGSGQIIVLGPPNSGKSSLVNSLTTAEPEVGEYPFTTTLPDPAMMEYENVQVQLVDLPPLHRDMSPGWMADAMRGADGAIMALDVADDDILDLTEAAFAFLADKNISLYWPEHLQSAAESLGSDDSPPDSVQSYPTLVVANKCEDEEAQLRLQLLQEMWETSGYPRLPLIRTSCYSGNNIELLRTCIWQLLGKVRVYTRPPGRKADLSAPFVLKSGSTALDLAHAIHKDIGAQFRYAKAWGKNTFDAQHVGPDYVLTDGDILEVHSDN